MQNKIPLLLALFLGLFAEESCNSNPYSSGARIYKQVCANCHLDHGEGLAALIPPLANADFLKKNRNRLPCIVRYGLKDTIVVNGARFSEQMQALPGLNEVQITNVLNYIGSSWGNNLPPFQLEEVRAVLNTCNSLPTGDTKTKQ